MGIDDKKGASFNDDFGGNPPTLVGGWIAHT